MQARALTSPDFNFRLQSSGFRVRNEGSGFKVSGERFRGFEVEAWGFGVWS